MCGPKRNPSPTPAKSNPAVKKGGEASDRGEGDAWTSAGGEGTGTMVDGLRMVAWSMKSGAEAIS
jgi:hypothetical protein